MIGLWKQVGFMIYFLLDEPLQVHMCEFPIVPKSRVVRELEREIDTLELFPS